MITATSFEHLTDGLARITPVLLDGTLKGTAMLTIAWLITSRMRRSSSAARHMVWLATLASLLVLPLLGRALPAWRILPESWDVRRAVIVQRPTEAPQVGPGAALPMASPRELPGLAADVQTALPLAMPTAAAPKPLSPWAWIGLAWLAGTTLLLLRLLLGVACLLWASWRLQACTDEDWRAALLQTCSDLNIGRRVQLLQGRDNAMPMTWGLFVPHLLVPAAASRWTPPRRRVVLLHELAHVKRWDCLTQVLAEVACAAQWFNPLAWLASKRMQNEAERACDDLVLARGSRPAEYAEHLLQIAASQHQGYLAAAMAAIPMARTLKLEGRLLAILDGKRSRRAMTLGALVLALALVAGVVVPVAMLRGANKPAASQKDAAATAPATGQAVAQLPGGLTVEVAGVSYHPSEGRQWWGPDGTVGEQYAFLIQNSWVNSRNQQIREFVVRLKGEGAEEAGLRWDKELRTGGYSSRTQPAKGVADGVLEFLVARLPATDKTATIRVDVATGPWMPLAEEAAGGLTARDGTDRKSPTVFSPAYKSDGGVGVSVSHIIIEGQVRIVAIDKDGQEHTTREVSSGSAGGIAQTTAHFASLPLKDVKSFRLEARGYLWVTFRNVSLEPGYKTDVQVEVGPVAHLPDEIGKQKTAEFRMGGVYTAVVREPAATQPDVAKARQPAKASTSANNIGALLRGLWVCMPQKDGRWPDDQPWPEDLRQIVEKGLGKAYDESADYLSNPQRPRMRPAYVYVKPSEPISRIADPGRDVVLFEAYDEVYDEWDDGINVGFLDGHVTFMTDRVEFLKLLGRENQKRIERYMYLGAPSSTPAAPLPGPVGAASKAPAAALPTPRPSPATQPEGEFYVMGTPRPGVFRLTGRKISLTQGVAAAGGLKPESKVVQLLRPGKDGVLGVVATYSVDDAPWRDSPILQPNDVIYISENPLGAKTVEITGDVPRPGVFSLPALGTLLKVLVAAGLNSADADRTQVTIRRAEPSGGRAFVGKGFEVGRVLRGEIPDPPLQPRDQIQVTVSKLAAPAAPERRTTSLPASPTPASQPQLGRASDMQVRIYTLRYADATETAAVLSKLLENRFGKDGSQIVADTRSNSVIVVGREEHQEAILEMVRSLDQPSERTAPVPQTRPAAAAQPDVDLEIVQVQSGDREDIAKEAQNIVDALFGKRSPLIEANPASSTIYITGSKEQRQIAVQVIRRLEQIAAGNAPDEPFRVQASNGTEVRMVPMRRSDLDEIAKRTQRMLDTIYGKQSPFVEARNGYLLLTGRAEHLAKAMEILGILEADGAARGPGSDDAAGPLKRGVSADALAGNLPMAPGTRAASGPAKWVP